MANEFIARNGITSLGNIVVSGSITTTGTVAISGSFASASFAATASSADNFLTRGTLTAQTLVVQTITSSVDFVTGSTRFGSIIGNTHQFTGSVSVTGSLAVVTTGTEFQVTSTGVNLGNALTDSHVISGSLRVNPNGLFVSSSGNIGIGTTAPAEVLDISGSLKIGNLKIQNVNGGSIGFNRNTADGTIYNPGYAAFQINGAYSGANYLDFQNYSSSGSYLGSFVFRNGYFGIGTTNPESKLQVEGGEVRATTSNAGVAIYYTAGTGEIAAYNWGGSAWIPLSYAGQYHIWKNSGTEVMRITAGGNVGINKTNPDSKLSIVDSSYNNYSLRLESQSGNTSGRWGGIGFGGESVNTKAAILFVSEGGSYSRGNLVFCNNSEFNQNNVTTADARMTITKEGNIGAPSGTNIYNASDIRLKQNITTITNGLNKIMGLNPVMFNWINGYVESEEGKNMLGFIAQEVQNIVPEAVESFAGGNTLKIGDLEITDPLRVNEKFIIPVLVKAIQELTARVQYLENK